LNRFARCINLARDLAAARLLLLEHARATFRTANLQETFELTAGSRWLKRTSVFPASLQ
jgi:hypothetical protein